MGPIETLPIEDFRYQIEVNLIGQVAVSQSLLPLIRQARGRVVFVSSIGGQISYPFAVAPITRPSSAWRRWRTACVRRFGDGESRYR